VKNSWQLERTMTPRGFAHTIELLGMTQEGCGRYLGVSGRTVRRYIDGGSAIPASHVLLLRALMRFRVTPLVPSKRRKA
jgi:hypothetical protein